MCYYYLPSIVNISHTLTSSPIIYFHLPYFITVCRGRRNKLISTQCLEQCLGQKCEVRPAFEGKARSQCWQTQRWVALALEVWIHTNVHLLLVDHLPLVVHMPGRSRLRVSRCWLWPQQLWDVSMYRSHCPPIDLWTPLIHKIAHYIFSPTRITCRTNRVQLLLSRRQHWACFLFSWHPCSGFFLATWRLRWRCLVRWHVNLRICLLYIVQGSTDDMSTPREYNLPSSTFLSILRKLPLLWTG